MTKPIRPASLADNTEERSLTEVLAEFGVRHEPAGNGSRYLFTEDGCIGTADVVSGWCLARLLQRLSQKEPA